MNEKLKLDSRGSLAQYDARRDPDLDRQSELILKSENYKQFLEKLKILLSEDDIVGARELLCDPKNQFDSSDIFVCDKLFDEFVAKWGPADYVVFYRIYAQEKCVFLPRQLAELVTKSISPVIKYENQAKIRHADYSGNQDLIFIEGYSISNWLSKLLTKLSKRGNSYIDVFVESINFKKKIIIIKVPKGIIKVAKERMETKDEVIKKLEQALENKFKIQVSKW